VHHRSSLNVKILLFVVAATLTSTATAHAEPPSPTEASASAPSLALDHSIYVELLGKAGLWGLGYDYQFHPRFAAGATASFYILDGERIFNFSPYLTAYLVGLGHHRWFVQAGPQLSYVQTPSPVPEWPGSSATGVGADLCSGYEYRARLLVRVFGMATLGQDGISPWLGVSLGWTL
jgi:hypothetical protein